MISSFARPSPTIRGSRERAADVGDQADARLGQPDDRVGRDPQVARERELHRAAEARAVDLGDRRLGHLLEQVPRVEDRRGGTRAGRPGRAASAPSAAKSMPEENIGPAPRSDDAVHVAVGRRVASASSARRSARR